MKPGLTLRDIARRFKDAKPLMGLHAIKGKAFIDILEHVHKDHDIFLLDAGEQKGRFYFIPINLANQLKFSSEERDRQSILSSSFHMEIGRVLDGVATGDVTYAVVRVNTPYAILVSEEEIEKKLVALYRAPVMPSLLEGVTGIGPHMKAAFRSLSRAAKEDGHELSIKQSAKGRVTITINPLEL